jgi:N-carbamoylputrescine amidase
VLDIDGSLAGKYRKMHIPDDPLYYEKFYFRRAIWASRAFRRATRNRRAGVRDQWFPEGARLAALLGPDSLLSDCDRLDP